jgi:hypothetical protein
MPGMDERDDSRRTLIPKPGSIPVGSPQDYAYLAALVALTLLGLAVLGVVVFIIQIAIFFLMPS